MFVDVFLFRKLKLKMQFRGQQMRELAKQKLHKRIGHPGKFVGDH